ncbi:2-keto-4-pentenoate hydratase/2-oxohepta-3-ene-1,7-dioic acid hydratase in catechol pathway [Pullulanibacillus pueri]|uniref:Fumarylacetoacetate hydrolase n=1 Tax=Pullulanibacillus pueri TaxID=1437324 RepID=A0A8J2ZXW7_9BACL|nr:fumarylacetoacetate hydrolase family protein [Pullulanibacillus pueri]MBM7680633.1 2-keto-4-pentenoate hydratase/2-oxohepta-3-ene-1,7-dioic acid hydratase in catechol pathway [Pullulanibacillus pueri]GGH83881.1 fumarylacetoacetate hydrolase [Pullulanibacillus pueri]
MNEIRNIYCVGRNYAQHAKELKNEVPTSPFLFSKPTHALVETQGQEIRLPNDQGAIHYEAEWVVHIRQPYEKGMSVDELVDQMALGIDFTLRDIQSELKKKGQPWLLAKGFKNSAVISPFIEFPGIEACKQVDFSLLKNGEYVQKGNIQEMIFDLQTIVDFAGQHFGLGKGDIIYTGTPAGVGPIMDKDHFALLWGQKKLGECSVIFANN